MERMMNIRTFSATLVALAFLGTAAPVVLMAAEPPTTWDDLQLVNSNRTSRLYLLPGANFQQYTKVMLDPTEVAFQQNWVRDFNRSSGTVSRRITDDDVNRVTNEMSGHFGDIFAEEYQRAGIQVVQAPGPDVLRVRTALIDLTISAPDIQGASRVRTVSWEAGQATLVVEARDSQTGALLGRALDRRVAGDRARAQLRNSVTNRADFKVLFRQWARDSIDGLNRLRSGQAVARR
jgi:hypothetical protein